MSIKDILSNDLKDSLKAKDTVRKNTVQGIRAAILQFEKDNLTELDDDGVLDVIAKELKKRRDIKVSAELKCLLTPEEISALSAEEISDIIDRDASPAILEADADVAFLIRSVGFFEAILLE